MTINASGNECGDDEQVSLENNKREEKEKEKSKRRRIDKALKFSPIPQIYKKSKKGIETSAIRSEHNGLSEIDIIETSKENKEIQNKKNRFNVFADDTVVEEKNEDEIEKNGKVKMKKERLIKMNDKEIKIRKR